MDLNVYGTIGASWYRRILRKIPGFGWAVRQARRLLMEVRAPL
jgi:hypothetical protein